MRGERDVWQGPDMDHVRDPIVDQPPPTPNDQPAVWDLVIADMHERNALGRARYGTPLQPHNGRDALVDAYQEMLDGAVYLRQAIEERKGGKETRVFPAELQGVGIVIDHDAPPGRLRIEQTIGGRVLVTDLDIEPRLLPTVTVSINGRDLEISDRDLSHEDIVRLSRPTRDALHTVTYSVRGQGGGTLLPGQSIRVGPGLVCDAAVTG